jgi:hypothetical protein
MEGQHAGLLRGIGIATLVGLVVLYITAWRWMKGLDDGADNGQEKEVASEEQLRSTGQARLPDARSSSRRERQGEGIPDGETGKALQGELQQDRRQGESGSRQELVEAPWLHDEKAPAD